MAFDEIVRVSITEFETPVPNVLEVESAFEISIVDEDGEDVALREPVTVTLPFTMPEGKKRGGRAGGALERAPGAVGVGRWWCG